MDLFAEIYYHEWYNGRIMITGAEADS